jgi:DNA topoisomerase-3
LTSSTRARTPLPEAAARFGNLNYSRGIGTPATRAAILERLVAVGYVRRDSRALVPTEKGVELVRLLREHTPALTNPATTSVWEARLQGVRDGQCERRDFLAAVKSFVRDVVGAVKSAAATTAAAAAAAIEPAAAETAKKRGPRPPPGAAAGGKGGKATTLGWCRKCNSGEVVTRESWKLWRCSNGQCTFRVFKTMSGRAIRDDDVRALLRDGGTPVLHGFTSKRTGAPFSARLALSKDCEPMFDFSASSASRPGTGEDGTSDEGR